jgi:hypothetical protein
MHQGTFEHLAGLPCTHDSRVNLHISTDYGQKKGAGELVAFLHGSSEKKLETEINASFPFAVFLAVQAPGTAIGGGGSSWVKVGDDHAVHQTSRGHGESSPSTVVG